MRAALVLAAAAVCLHAQPTLDRPVIGQLLDRQGLLRPVTGVGGNFQLDPPAARSVLATACSHDLCVAKTNAAILSGSFSTPAPPGRALIALDGLAAVFYFREQNQFARWQSGSLTPLAIYIDGEALALRSVNSVLNLAVRRDSEVWIVAADGTILDSLPAETSAVLLLSDAVVYSSTGELVLRKSTGVELRFPVSGVNALFALGEDYIEAVTPLADYALRTQSGREQLYVLPQAPANARFREKQ
jgi:hypothetical protein